MVENVAHVIYLRIIYDFLNTRLCGIFGEQKRGGA